MTRLRELNHGQGPIDDGFATLNASRVGFPREGAAAYVIEEVGL